MRNTEGKTSSSRQKCGMIKSTKTQAPTFKPTQDLKCAQCELKAMLEMMLKTKWS